MKAFSSTLCGRHLRFTSIDQMAVALLKKLEAIAAGTDNNSPELLPFGM